MAEVAAVRGTLQEVADHLGTTTSAAYRRAKDPADEAVRQVKRGTYEADDGARGAGTASIGRGRAASLPSVAPEPDLGPITHLAFQLTLEVAVPVGTPALHELADALTASLRVDDPGGDFWVLGRHHSMFWPRRGWPIGVPQIAGITQEKPA